MKNILIPLEGYLPAKGYGGPVVSIDNICALLKEEYKFYIVTCDHDLGDNKRLEGIQDGWNELSNCNVIYLRNEELDIAHFREILTEVEPEVVYINSLFDIVFTPKFLYLAKKRKCKVILAPRGQLGENAIRHNRRRKELYIKVLGLLGFWENILFHSTGEDDTRGIKKNFDIIDSNIVVIENVAMSPAVNMCHKKKVTGEAKLVFMSRIMWKKNLSFVLDFLPAVSGRVMLDIFGPIEDVAYWKECLKKIEQLPETIKVTYKGVLEHDKVHETLAQYDAFILPTMNENYGHVIAEALYSDIPVILSDQTPWNEVATNRAGWVCCWDSAECFVNAINELVNMDEQMLDEYRRNATEFVNKRNNLDELKKKYLEMFE